MTSRFPGLGKYMQCNLEAESLKKDKCTFGLGNQMSNATQKLEKKVR